MPTPRRTTPRDGSRRRSRLRCGLAGTRTGRPPAARRRSGSTGGSSRRRCATPSRGTPSTSGGATTATSRATTRCRTSSRSTTSCSRSARWRRARPAGRTPASRSRSTTSIPFPTNEAIGRARGTAWCAATLADELRAAGLPEVDGWPSFDLLLLGIGGDGHLLSVFPDSPALDSAELGLAIPAPTHIEPHVERVTLNPAIVGRRAGVADRGPGWRQGRRDRGDLRVRAGPATLARPAGPTVGRDLDPRRGGRRGPAALNVPGAPSRIVTSADGTPIAVFSSGDGPPLVLVHGATADHTTFRVVGPRFAERFAVHAIDRRGRGASGDGPAYAIEREFEDVAAVAEALAEASGAPVGVFGHSYGGRCALGAALLTDTIGRVVSYEGAPTPAGSSYHPSRDRASPARPAGRRRPRRRAARSS